MSKENEAESSGEVKNFCGGVVTAFRTLSIIPIPGRDARSISSSLAWFPIVGGLLGGLIYGIILLADNFIIPDWSRATAFIAVAAGVCLTRGFHLDGLADWADSFGAMNNRRRMLDIMKDSHIGAFGVIALIIILLGKWIAITRLCVHHDFLWIIPAYIISRTAQVEMAVTLPYARAEGGTAAAFVREATSLHRWMAFALAVIILFACFGWKGLVLLLAGEIIRIAFGLWCRHRYGGVTGDLLGAGSEIIETSILFLVAAGIPGF